MRNFTFSAAAAALALTLVTGGQIVGAAFTAPAYAQTAQKAGNLSMPELQSLMSPIALYPDSLLSQMLMAATYPLEVVGDVS